MRAARRFLVALAGCVALGAPLASGPAVGAAPRPGTAARALPVSAGAARVPLALGGGPTGALAAPPPTIVDGIRQGNPVVRRVSYDDDVAVYFGEGLSTDATWMVDHVRAVWRYMKRTYGPFGPDPRLYVVAHANRAYDYATIGTRFDAAFGHRNVIDLGGSWDWQRPAPVNYEVITHELAHLIEGGGKDTRESPSFEFWKDGPWPEIAVYDLYRGVGREAWAEDWKRRMLENTNGSYMTAVLPGQYHFFRDWFYPIYRQYGGAAVLNRYFTLLSQCFPKRPMPGGGQEYARRATFGEVVHFWSAAAGADLKPLAARAFGWSRRMDAELAQAQQTFGCARTYPRAARRDTTPPTLSLEASAVRVTRPSVLTLRARAADAVGVTSVEFFQNGRRISEVLRAPFTLPLTLVPGDNGPLTFTARAYDLAGNAVTGAPVRVEVAMPPGGGGGRLPPPPATLIDRVHDDAPEVKRVYYDAEIAVYFGHGLDPNLTWMVAHARQVWRHAKRTFGAFGPDPRLYLVAHQNPAYRATDMRSRFDEGLGFRNAVDLGGAWSLARPSQEVEDAISREVSRIVEAGGKNVRESPTYAWWDVGPFTRLFTYDADLAAGHAERAAAALREARGDPIFDRWLYPLYTEYGGLAVLDRYFGLLARCFPTRATEAGGRPAREYTRRATPGEVLHFFSGAAGTNLQPRYARAFGWNATTEAEFRAAQRQFPCAAYPR